MIGLAKREEEIILPEQKESVLLPRDSLAPRAFAEGEGTRRTALPSHITGCSVGERQTRSNLKNIPGIGDKKARAPLVYFKKIENIANADLEEIMKVEGF